MHQRLNQPIQRLCSIYSHHNQLDFHCADNIFAAINIYYFWAPHKSTCSWSRMFTYTSAKYISFNFWYLIPVNIPCLKSVRIPFLILRMLNFRIILPVHKMVTSHTKAQLAWHTYHPIRRRVAVRSTSQKGRTWLGGKNDAGKLHFPLTIRYMGPH